jgi:hypothetical protein
MNLPFPLNTLSQCLPLQLLTFFCRMYLLRLHRLRAPGTTGPPDVRRPSYLAARPHSAPCFSRTANCCRSTQPAPADPAYCWGPSTDLYYCWDCPACCRCCTAASPSTGASHAGRFGVTYQCRPPPPPATPTPPRGRYGVVYGRRPRPVVIHGPQPTSQVSGTVGSLQPPTPPPRPMQGPPPPVRLGHPCGFRPPPPPLSHPMLTRG